MLCQICALVGLLVLHLQPVSTAPVAEVVVYQIFSRKITNKHLSQPVTVEMYMGTLMAAALLAKGYLFGALIHSGLADVSKRRPYGGYGRYYDLYGRLNHPHFAAAREQRKAQ